MIESTISHNGYVVKVYRQQQFVIFTFCEKPSLSLTLILSQIKQNFISLNGILDIVIGIDSISVFFDQSSHDKIVSHFYQMTFKEATFNAQHFIIEVNYNGADLISICADLAMDVEHLITLHSQSTYYVAMIGFLPGFVYLGGGNKKLFVPRKAKPSHRVNSGDVAIANGYTGIYPSTSPGGWHVIGNTKFTNFDNEKGCQLSIGDTITFVPC